MERFMGDVANPNWLVLKSPTSTGTLFQDLVQMGYKIRNIHMSILIFDG